MLDTEPGFHADRASVAGLWLDAVLESRTGHPLMLAALAAEVGRRAGLPVRCFGADRLVRRRGRQRPAVARRRDDGRPPRRPRSLRPHCAHELAFAALIGLSERYERAGDTRLAAAPRCCAAACRCDDPPMEPIVVAPGTGARVGNVEFLARTVDTPRFTFGLIDFAPGREQSPHVHADEDDAFYILEGSLTFLLGGEEVLAPPGTFVLVPPGNEHGFRNDTDAPVRILNIHAPAGFDRRIGLDA